MINGSGSYQDSRKMLDRQPLILKALKCKMLTNKVPSIPTCKVLTCQRKMLT